MTGADADAVVAPPFGPASPPAPPDSSLPSVKATGLVNALAFALGAASAIILARLLGATERGELVIASIGPILASILCTLGVEESIVYLNARASDSKERLTIAWSGFATAVVSGIVGSVVALAVQYWYVGSRAGDIDRRVLFLYATIPLPVAVIQDLLGNLRGTGRYRMWNIVRMTTPSVYIMLIAGLAAAGRLSVSTALLAHWSANVPLALYLLVSLRLEGGPNIESSVCRQLAKLGSGNHLITVQRLANERADQFVMARVVPAHSLGNYAVAATYASCGLQLGLAVGFQLYSHVSRSGSIRRRDFVALCRKSFLLMSAIGVVGAAAGWLVLPALLGNDFKDSVVPAALLLAGGPPLTVGTLYASAWKASAEPLRAARAETVGLLTTAILLACLLGPWGIRGAAVASVAAYTVVALILVLGPAPSVIGAGDPGRAGG